MFVSLQLLLQHNWISFNVTYIHILKASGSGTKSSNAFLLFWSESLQCNEITKTAFAASFRHAAIHLLKLIYIYVCVLMFLWIASPGTRPPRTYIWPEAGGELQEEPDCRSGPWNPLAQWDHRHLDQGVGAQRERSSAGAQWGQSAYQVPTY